MQPMNLFCFPSLLVSAWSRSLWFFVFLTLIAPVRAARFEVAQRHPQASDDGPGTAEHPWKTIAKAAAGVGPGDVVVIRGGVYRESAVVKAGGTAQQPIRFEAAPGEGSIECQRDLMPLLEFASDGDRLSRRTAVESARQDPCCGNNAKASYCFHIRCGGRDAGASRLHFIRQCRRSAFSSSFQRPSAAV
jgi:hypothetical protein